MKDGNWIPIDKKAVYWLPKKGRYSTLEALICHTVDVYEKKSFTVNGYAKLWGWSRNKVRRFLSDIRTLKGHHMDTHRTLTGQGVTLKNIDLQLEMDTERTLRGHLMDTQKDTTRRIDNIKEKKHIYGEFHHVRLTDEEYSKLKDRFNSRLDHWIKELDEGIERKGYKYRSHYLALIKWAENPINKEQEKPIWET